MVSFAALEMDAYPSDWRLRLTKKMPDVFGGRANGDSIARHARTSWVSLPGSNPPLPINRALVLCRGIINPLSVLCSLCHQRPATVHITITVEGQQQRQDLCESCAPASVPGLHEWANKMAGKTCEFCGALATAGAGASGSERFWCQDCATTVGGILEQVCSELPRPTDPAQFGHWIEQATQETVRRMRARSSEDLTRAVSRGGKSIPFTGSRCAEPPTGVAFPAFLVL